MQFSPRVPASSQSNPKRSTWLQSPFSKAQKAFAVITSASFTPSQVSASCTQISILESVYFWLLGNQTQYSPFTFSVSLPAKNISCLSGRRSLQCSIFQEHSILKERAISRGGGSGGKGACEVASKGICLL